MILLAPSLLALRKMLKICQEFSIEFKIRFNASKCKLLVFGERNVEDISVEFNNVRMKPCPIELHLGIQIGSDAQRARIEASVYDMYRRTNILLAQFHHASIDVKYSLFKSYCMSLYGCTMWDLSKRRVQDIYTAWRKCVRRVMGISARTHNALLPHIINDVDIQSIVERRIVRFLQGISKSSNHYLKLGFQLMRNGSRSAISNSVNFICNKHGVGKDELFRDGLILQGVTDLNAVKGAQIRELLEMREGNWDFLELEEINVLLEYLCEG